MGHTCLPLLQQQLNPPAHSHPVPPRLQAQCLYLQAPGCLLSACLQRSSPATNQSFCTMHGQKDSATADAGRVQSPADTPCTDLTTQAMPQPQTRQEQDLPIRSLPITFPSISDATSGSVPRGRFTLYGLHGDVTQLPKDAPALFSDLNHSAMANRTDKEANTIHGTNPQVRTHQPMIACAGCSARTPVHAEPCGEHHSSEDISDHLLEGELLCPDGREPDREGRRAQGRRRNLRRPERTHAVPLPHSEDAAGP